MKILQVRFRNLNSLVGEWEVDFTHPAYEANGIFAITGPTGAGKSTILDAVCLALFGMTPRLDSITKSSNQIMSRQTGDCFAEVTFATDKGRFRCHWSQRRARGKNHGELQAQKHEIADVETGQIIDATIRGVPPQVEKVTGMDFERFTRSMLLAQGGFAVFLQANANDRAPILEQITGTGIYSKISMQVHERTAAEKNRLEAMRAEITGLPIITPEEEQELSVGKQQKQQAATALSGQLEQKKAALAWLESLTRLQQEWEETRQAQAKIQAEDEAFAPERQRLHRANLALELAPDYTALSASRGKQKEDQTALKQCQLDRPTGEKTQLDAQTSLEKAKNGLKTKKATQADLLTVIQEVSKLDGIIAAGRTELQKAEASLAKAQSELAAQRQKQEADVAALTALSKQKDELRAHLEAAAGDARLAEQLAGVRERIDFTKARAVNLAAKRAAAAAAEAKRQTLQADFDSRKSQLASAKQAFVQAQTAMSQEQTELAAVLNGKDLSAWIELQSHAIAELDMVKTALGAWQDRQHHELKRRRLGERDAELRQEQTSATEQLQQLQEEIRALEMDVEHRRVQVALLQRIRSLEEERGKLQDGCPCPLCGATSHPYAAGNIPVVDDAEKQLSEGTKRLRQLDCNRAEVKNRLETIAGELAGLTAENADLAEKVKAATEKITASCASLGLNVASPATDTGLERILSELKSEKRNIHDQAEQIFQKAAQLEKKRRQTQDRIDQARGDVATYEKAAREVDFDLKSALADLARLQGEATDEQAACDLAMAALQGELAEYGITDLDLVSLDATYQSLERRQQQRAANAALILELEKKHLKLTSLTGNQADQIGRQENGLDEGRRQCEQIRQNLAAILEERQRQFGDRDPAQEQKRLADEIAAAEQALDGARAAADKAQELLRGLETKEQELGQAIARRQAELDQAGAGFVARLAESGFNDEQDFLAAQLSEPERRLLANQASQLNDRKTAAAALERQKNEQLAAEHRKNITGESSVELAAAIQALQEKHQSMVQEIGAIQQKLNENSERRRQLQEKTDALVRQQTECGRWESLDQLIGSADGKKYRNFAQGLTFDIMIRHANAQLQKLTDRYLLIRSEDTPLELNVIDNYQAGDIRTTKNLSGGESFIVSLSLALGLAQMVSSNIRVDSLFLDEGFGTLDEDALDTALDTLASLRHDGKLIGIISHVTAIKDRIGAQIKVIPKSGGKSGIDGPGCRQITDSK